MLKIFPRHTDECLNGPAGEPAKGLLHKHRALEGKALHDKLRKHKGCGCTLWFSGTWAGATYPRESLHVNDWKKAEDLLKERMQGKAERASTKKLAGALEAWHETKRLAQRKAGTIRHHREVGAMLQAVAGEDALLASIDGGTIRGLRLKWMDRGVENASQRTYMNYLNGFFRFCAAKAQGWITESPMPEKEDWPPMPSRKDREETLPLDPEGGKTNYLRVLGALRGPRVWRTRERGGRPEPILRGERLALIGELMFEGGLRASDAVMFRPAKLKLDTEIASYTFIPIKTERKEVVCTTYIPVALAKKIRELPPLSMGYPFFDGAGLDATEQEARHEYIIKSMRKELGKAGESVGVPDVRPHRFRDSFAVYQLEHGTDIRLVSKMLGHTSVKTTEASYTPWVDALDKTARRAYIRSKQEETAANIVPITRVG